MEACVQSARHAATERAREAQQGSRERDKQTSTLSAMQPSKAWWPHRSAGVFTTETAGNTEGFCLILGWWGGQPQNRPSLAAGLSKRDSPFSAAHWVLALLLLLLWIWLLSTLLGGLAQEHCWDRLASDKRRSREHSCLPNAWLLHMSIPACVFK